MKRFRKNINVLKSANDAAVGIVVAVLLVGLALAVMWTIQAVYVPNWMEQKEAEHMEQVANQFTQIKFAIDTQSAIEQGIPISTSITLGSKELPFLTSSRAFGALRIATMEYSIIITNDSSSFPHSLGRIKYSSENAYFLDQSYIYEAGAIISNQSEGNVMSIKPYFYADYNEMFKDVNISLNIVNISGVGGKTSVSGYGTYPIQTEFIGSNNSVIDNVQNFTINTSNLNAWYIFVNSTLVTSGLNESNDFWINATADNITVEFHDSLNVDFFVKKIPICELCFKRFYPSRKNKQRVDFWGWGFTIE